MGMGAFWTFALAGIFANYLGRRGSFRSVETLGPSRASAVQITNPMFAAVPCVRLAAVTLAGILTISAQISVIGATGYLPGAIVLAILSALPMAVVPVSLLVLRNIEDLRATTLLGTGLVLTGVAGSLLR